MTRISKDKELLTRAEAAEFLAIQPGTLASWAYRQTQDLPYVRVGRCVRYRRADLEKFILQNLVIGGGDIL